MVRDDKQVLTGGGATGNGVWFPWRHVDRSSVHISGITNATVEIDASNKVEQPENSEHGTSVDSITADAIVVVDFPTNWLKVRITAFVSGVIDAKAAREIR